jgi:hypothetical protein
MPTLAWISFRPVEPGAPVEFMASHFRVPRPGDVPPFFVDSTRSSARSVPATARWASR